jgi:hypothetical protein
VEKAALRALKMTSRWFSSLSGRCSRAYSTVFTMISLAGQDPTLLVPHYYRRLLDLELLLRVVAALVVEQPVRVLGPGHRLDVQDRQVALDHQLHLALNHIIYSPFKPILK